MLMYGIYMLHATYIFTHIHIYIIYIYVYIYIIYIITLYVFFFENVKKYKIHDETFKIQLYFDFYKSMNCKNHKNRNITVF